MTQLNIMDSRNQMASTYNHVYGGEREYIRRKNQLYTIVPVREEELPFALEMALKIENARKDFRERRS